MDVNVIDENEYERKEKIGSGRFGSVYRMVHRETGEEVAAKTFELSSDGYEEYKTFTNEFQCLSMLDHPCVLKLRGISLPYPQINRPATIYTPYMKKGSLAQYMCSNELDD